MIALFHSLALFHSFLINSSKAPPVVHRYDLPGVNAMNFVLEASLGGIYFLYIEGFFNKYVISMTSKKYVISMKLSLCRWRWNCQPSTGPTGGEKTRLILTSAISGEGLWPDSLRLCAHWTAKLGGDEGKLDRELTEDVAFNDQVKL